jgi:shikimate kinase
MHTFAPHTRIYLIGMPASGKTTLGRFLAELLHYECIDLDKQIEIQEGATIPEIFERKGEDYFRQLERRALIQSFEWQKKVIATGGGTACFFDNMELIKENGFSIFLGVSSQELVNRIRRQTHIHRPLFQLQTDEELLAELNQKLAQRQPYYKQANMMVSAEDRNARQLAEYLIDFFQRWKDNL